MIKPFEITLEDDRIKDVRRKILEIRECKHAMPIGDDRIRGYHIIFTNNYLLSIQFGWGNYSDYHDLDYYDTSVKDYRTSFTAEIAYWKLEDGKDSPMIQFEENGDTVLGWQTFEQVHDWMKKISELTE